MRVEYDPFHVERVHTYEDRIAAGDGPWNTRPAYFSTTSNSLGGAPQSLTWLPKQPGLP